MKLNTIKFKNSKITMISNMLFRKQNIRDQISLDSKMERRIRKT